MSSVDRIIHEIQGLDRVEQEAILVALAGQIEPQAASPHGAAMYGSIVSTPGICGGAARLIRTRIPVWLLERMRQLGISEIETLRSYPTLQAADLAQAWQYVAQHREEIAEAIRENEEA